MSGFIEGEDRHQATLFPERLDDYIAEDSAVRVIDVFVDDLDISGLGFKTAPNMLAGRLDRWPKLAGELFLSAFIQFLNVPLLMFKSSATMRKLVSVCDFDEFAHIVSPLSWALLSSRARSALAAK